MLTYDDIVGAVAREVGREPDDVLVIVVYDCDMQRFGFRFQDGALAFERDSGWHLIVLDGDETFVPDLHYLDEMREYLSDLAVDLGDIIALVGRRSANTSMPRAARPDE